MFYLYHSQSIIAGAFAKNDYKLAKKAAIRVLQVSIIMICASDLLAISG